MSRFTQLIFFCAFIAISALVLTQIGWILLVDFAISDAVYLSSARKASGKVAMLVVDEDTIRDAKRYPYDRSTLARALQSLSNAGVEKVLLDTLLNLEQDKDEDNQLADAMSLFPPAKLALPVVRTGGSPADPKLLKPAAKFSQNTTLVTMDFVTHSDRRLRSVQNINAPGALQGGPWLSGAPKSDREAKWIDFSIDPSTIPRYGLKAFVNGEIPLSAFKNRTVIFGRLSGNIEEALAVPAFNRISRTEIISLFAETIQQDREIRVLGWTNSFALLFFITMLFALALRFMTPMGATLLFLLLSAIWLQASLYLFRSTGLQLPIFPVLVALLMIWQRTALAHSALYASTRRIKNRLMGMDKATLFAVLDAMPDAAVIFNADGQILGHNDSFAQLADKGNRTLNKKSRLADLFDGNAILITECLHSPNKKSIQITFNDLDDNTMFFEARPRAVSTSTGLVGIAGFKDVTAVQARENELVHLAFHDPLTGLGNRLEFTARLEALCTRKKSRQAAVFLIDLDGFKGVNDTFGHAGGDLLLTAVGARIKSLLQPGTTAARLGGDEFALIVGFTDKDDITRLAQAILSSLAVPFMVEGKSARVGASIGISYFPEHSGEPGLLLRLADQAMYKAKENKPSFCVHDVSAIAMAG